MKLILNNSKIVSKVYKKSEVSITGELSTNLGNAFDNTKNLYYTVTITGEGDGAQKDLKFSRSTNGATIDEFFNGGEIDASIINSVGNSVDGSVNISMLNSGEYVVVFGTIGITGKIEFWQA